MIRAIIVEDEAPLRELLRMLLNQVDEEIEIIAECDTIDKATEAIETLQPDLIFLDVILPGGTGFNLLERHPEIGAEVIFITAFDSFAVEAFRHAAVGYLLKPVDTEDLRIALNHAKRRIRSNSKQSDVMKLLQVLRGSNDSPGGSKIGLPTADGFLFVNAEEIISCESDKVYTWVLMQGGKKVLCSYNIGEFRRILPEQMFFQVHKSYIISLRYVASYNGKDNTVTLTDGTIIPVSRRNKAAFLNNFRLVARNME